MPRRRRARAVAARLAAAAALVLVLLPVAGAPSGADFADRGAVGLALRSAEPVPVLFGGGLDAGDAWSLGWDAAGALYTWGSDDRGQLGRGEPGDAVTRPGRVAALAARPVRQASAGLNLGIALTEDGGVWTWGNPDVGGNTATPRRLAFFDDLGDPVAGVSAGGYYYLAWTEGGALYSWGNPTARLGRSATDAQEPRRVTAQGLDARHVTSASAGRFHGAAVTGGDAVVWGEGNGDREGRTVAGPVAGAVAAVAAGTRHTLLVAGDGSLWTTGGAATASPVAGLAGIVGAATSSPVSGDSGFWAWDAAVGLWAWGSNDSGLLGLGTEGGVVAAPQPVAAGSGTALVAGGSTHALHDSGSGEFAGAGRNDSGQLGDGTLLGRATFQLAIPVGGWP